MYGEPFAIPRARRARLHQLVRRRRGLPRRLHAGRAARAGSSTSARATRTIPSTTTRTSSGCSPTRSQWAAPRLRPAPRRAARSRRVGWFERALNRCASASSGVGWAGQQHIKAYAALDGVELVGDRRARGGRARGARRGVSASRISVARWEDLLDARRPRGRQRRRADVPARADRDRGARARAPRPLREADRARTAPRRTRWSQAARAAGRVLDVAFNHRRRGDVQRLKAADRRGPAGAALLREGVVAAPDRHPDARQLVHAVRRWRAAARWWTSACTSSTTRSSCSATPP